MHPSQQVANFDEDEFLDALFSPTETGCNLTFTWCPSHCDVRGNELADVATNEGTAVEQEEQNHLCESVTADIGLTTKHPLLPSTERGCHLTFTWCPSHCVVRGNELADVATKEGTAVEQEEENHHCESVTADIGQTTKDPLVPTTERGCHLTFTWCPSHCVVRGNELTDMATKEGTAVEQEEENHHCESVTADIGQTTKHPLLPTTERGCHLTFTWCPSHCVVRGNELTDMATKEGTAVEQEEENHHCESVTADIGQTTKHPLLPTTD